MKLLRARASVHPEDVLTVLFFPYRLVSHQDVYKQTSRLNGVNLHL